MRRTKNTSVITTPNDVGSASHNVCVCGCGVSGCTPCTPCAHELHDVSVIPRKGLLPDTLAACAFPACPLLRLPTVRVLLRWPTSSSMTPPRRSAATEISCAASAPPKCVASCQCSSAKLQSWTASRLASPTATQNNWPTSSAICTQTPRRSQPPKFSCSTARPHRVSPNRSAARKPKTPSSRP